jgi:hypothetical protein
MHKNGSKSLLQKVLHLVFGPTVSGTKLPYVPIEYAAEAFVAI